MRSRLNFFLFKDWSASCALPAFLARIAVGYAFFIAGLNEILHVGFAADGLNTIMPLAQLVFGAFLLIGFLTLVSSAVLLLNMLFAIPQLVTTGFWTGIGAYLYTPEVLIILLLFWLIFAGGGKWSVDYYIGAGRANT